MITVLSLICLGNIGSSIKIPNKDKYVHFIFYFVFVVLWFLVTKGIHISKKTNLIVVLSAIGYGILMEICQGFTKTRTPEVMDAVANAAKYGNSRPAINVIPNSRRLTSGEEE